MALPQVHYYLAKPTQHMPRQWNFSRRISSVQALCQWIQMGYIVSYMDTTLGFDKYMSSNCEKSYMQVSHSYQLARAPFQAVPGQPDPVGSNHRYPSQGSLELLDALDPYQVAQVLQVR